MYNRCLAIALVMTVWLIGRAQCAQYAVATANPDATSAGMRILAMGGSAADAAVAIQMVLGVVEPQSSGLGGGAIALYRGARTRRITAWDGLSKSPSAYEPQSGAIAKFSHSGAAVGVPGALRMLEAMHREHGRLPWSRLFEPAIELAEKGFAVSPYLARSLASAARIGMPVPDWLKDASGNTVAQGAIVRNPALGQTLQVVARDGADALYVGLAEQMASTAHAASPMGRMTADDVRDYKAAEREPLCMPFRQRTLCAVPPPSYGGIVVLEVLGMLATRPTPPAPFLDLAFVHRFIDAGRLAEADRMAVVGDPDTGPVAIRGLLDPARLQARAARIKDTSVIEDPHSACGGSDQAPEPSTSQIAIVDAQGDAVAMTTTININFGAWLTVGGFFLNDATTNFAQPGGCPANAPAGGKRAETSMVPVMAIDAHRSVVLVGGSAGAGEIVDYVAQAVLELLDGRNPAEALDEGHVSTAKASYPSTAGLVELEQGRAIAQLAQPLTALGHRVRITALQSGTAFIVRRNGHWEGAADPRRDGTYASAP